MFVRAFVRIAWCALDGVVVPFKIRPRGLRSVDRRGGEVQVVNEPLHPVDACRDLVATLADRFADFTSLHTA